LKYSLIIFFFIINITFPLHSQDVRDGAFDKREAIEMKVIQYPNVREADVLWSSRIWRVIDLREKINHPLYYPIEPIKGRISLFESIIKGIKENNLIAFNS